MSKPARGPVPLDDITAEAVAIRRQRFTRAHIARHMGRNAANVKDLEDGVSRPLINTFVAYAEAMGYKLALVPIDNKTGDSE